MFASGVGVARATRKHGESALIWRALCARQMSALNEKCTSGMLPVLNRKVPVLRAEPRHRSQNEGYYFLEIFQ
jgi:hypothetical protein